MQKAVFAEIVCKNFFYRMFQLNLKPSKIGVSRKYIEMNLSNSDRQKIKKTFNRRQESDFLKKKIDTSISEIRNTLPFKQKKN